MRPVSNACSEGVGEVPDDEVNAHLGNPGEELPFLVTKMSPYLER
jgi:hypothetical protein